MFLKHIVYHCKITCIHVTLLVLGWIKFLGDHDTHTTVLHRSAETSEF